MGDRKKIEIEYYEKKAEEFLREESKRKWLGDFEGFGPQNLESFRLWLRKRNSFNFPSEIRSRKSNRN